ncbi:MAG: hypothetical protein HQ530_01865 [Parcubacteria group bacterium]|nr:hypothetical protein [Parcubacteria group bacterium]
MQTSKLNNSKSNDFHNEGFLGKEITNLKNKTVSDYKNIFDFYEDINKFANSQKSIIEVNNEDYKNLAVFTLYLKSLATFQAIYCLCKNYFLYDAHTLLRGLYEAATRMRYCSIKDEYAKYFIANYLHGKTKVLNRVINQPKKRTFPAEINIKEAKKLKDKNEKNLNKMESERIISLEEMAREIGDIKTYNIYYDHASGYAHSDIRVLEKYLQKNKKGDVIGFNEIPDPKETKRILISSIEFILCTLFTLSDSFGVPEKKEIELYNNRKLKLK